MSDSSISTDVTANLDGNGQMPEQGHHIQHRSVAPHLRKDLSNYTGLGWKTHHDHHTCGAPVPKRVTLADIW